MVYKIPNMATSDMVARQCLILRNTRTGFYKANEVYRILDQVIQNTELHA